MNQKRARLQSQILTWALGIVCLFFTQDVVTDAYEHFAFGHGYSAKELFHLIAEVIAVVVMTGTIMLLVRYTQTLRDSVDSSMSKLHALRVNFHDHVKEQFTLWGLTKAESDVALFILRGVATEQIADFRSCSIATVKVHAHNVFKKAGVSSRQELMALFLEDFIDVGQNASLPSG